MKLFKKLLILNWHYISQELIELDDINFLTGKNASGKSTVIDAMQLLLLGDTTGNFFNKAANDQSRRTLIGYAKGELSDSDTTFKFLRDGRFATHIAMEVYDDIKKSSFVFGFVMDVEGDNSSDKRFYWMDGPLPDFQFVKDGRAMFMEEIRAYFKTSGIKNIPYGTHGDYRNDFRVKMGNLNEKYFQLFKKAVAFKPDMDLKRFITEFICDTENQVDIHNMQDNIRHYERLKQEAEEIAAMVEHLEAIEAVFSDYTKEKQNEKLYGYLIQKGDMEALREEADALRKKVLELEEKLKADAQRLFSYQKDIDSAQDEIQKKNAQLVEFEPYRIEQESKREVTSLKSQNNGLKQDVEKLSGRVRGVCRQWIAALEQTFDGEWEPMENLAAQLRAVESECKECRFDRALLDIQEAMYQLKLQTQENSGELERSLHTVTEEIRKSKEIQKRLNQGHKNYEAPIRNLKVLLDEKLSEAHGQAVTAEVFCELIEVQDERWRKAIEGYLHTQKFNLIVAPQYFEEALRLYDAHKHELKLYGVGLVDVGKLTEQDTGRAPGSLAEAIATENPHARAYADYLLGAVIKCENVAHLRTHRIAITPSCMLYKNYVASQLNPIRYDFPYIGQQAVKRQLELMAEKLQLLEAELKALDLRLKPYRSLNALMPLTVENLEDYGDARAKHNTSLTNDALILKLQKTIEGLDMRSVIQFRDEVKVLEELQKARIREGSSLEADMKHEKEQVTAIRQEKLPAVLHRVKEKQLVFESAYSADYMEATGKPRYMTEYERLGSHARIRDNFDQSYKTAQNGVQKRFRELVEDRSRFETLYRRDLGVTAETNDKYGALLKGLQDTELPSFTAKIDEAIQKAQQEFRDDFISKLKSNIDTVNRQIDALNASLKTIPFGKDQYRFQVTPSSYYRKYYDMIMDDMLMNGFNLFSSDFQDRHKEALNELFKKIVDVGEGAISATEREELERNIEKYTDYRTYLDFDLVVTDESGDKSHLSKMLNKKSGGETQTPFFISVLASFHRLYGLNDKRREDTMRLVIFDEAFSKMDHERIEESMKLLRKMRFQALISAPTEKVANISPFADKTLCVLRSKRTTTVREWSKLDLEVQDEISGE